MRRLSTIGISLFFIACGPAASNKKLENEVAQLRLEVNALKLAQQADSGARGGGQGQEMRDEINALKANQIKLQEELAKEGPRRRAARPIRKRPNPREVYALAIDNAPFEGAKDAKVTIVKNYEYACPYCYKSRETVKQLLKKYKKELKVVYKSFIVHPSTATEPALAACAAANQGKFSKMDELIWKFGYQKRDFSAENMEKLARRIGLKMKLFKADRDGVCKERTQEHQKQAAAVGVTGTPAFYINGRFLSGAQPFDRFQALIDEELGKANERIAKGEASVENYYEKFVVETGLKTLK